MLNQSFGKELALQPTYWSYSDIQNNAIRKKSVVSTLFYSRKHIISFVERANFEQTDYTG